MEEDYIKAPWHTGGFQNLVVNDANNETVLACPGGRTLKEMKAKSALIAAAPSLKSALEEAIAYIDDLLGSRLDEVHDNLVNNGEDVVDRLRAAISKAEGKA